jgi:hypothetical protein
MADWPEGLTLSPITTWEGSRTPARERRSVFSAPFSSTLETLRRELYHLGATDVVLEVAIPAGPRYWRNDGRPRAGVTADHPGVVLALRSVEKGDAGVWPGGRARFATDRFTTWQQNLRAIALGLEALRKFDRYGLGDDQHYRGFAQLPPGGPNVVRGHELIAHFGSVARALRATHPDTRQDGYTDADFEAVQAARVAA